MSTKVSIVNLYLAGALGLVLPVLALVVRRTVGPGRG
jgi:hypothetical protein